MDEEIVVSDEVQSAIDTLNEVLMNAKTNYWEATNVAVMEKNDE